MKSKITILFDAGPLVNGPRSGVGKYTQGLIEALAADYPNELELIGHYFDFLGKKGDISLPAAPNIRYRKTVLVPGRILNMLRRLGVWYPFEFLVKERGDFHLFPGFVGWPSLWKTASAPVIHDITYLDFPEYVNGPARYDLQKLVPKTIQRAAFIITNSDSSKNGLQKAYDLSNKPIVVAHIPPVDIVQIGSERADTLVADLGIDSPYILFFGTLEPRKNLVGLLQAYETLPEDIRNTYALVLAGGQGWHDSEILSTIERLRSDGLSIHQTGYVSDEQRAALFQKAALFVLPSFYEGFGMPLLEAMSYKTPMLVSDIAAHREVAGDAAIYCDPSEVKNISKQLVALMRDESLQKRLVSRGSERLKDFSWHNVTKAVYEHIKQVVA